MEKYKHLLQKAQEPLTDKEYLEKYISFMHNDIIAKQFPVAAIMDNNSKVISLNKATALIHGYKRIDETIDKTARDSKSSVAEYACKQKSHYIH